LEFSLALFVTACPCGIGLAAPTALLVGSGVAAKLGVLARGGGEAFQEAAQVDLIVFDKTGTLTEGGEPRVTDAELVKNYAWPTGKPVSSTENTIAAIAYEIEGASSHPLAIALRNYCHKDSAASNLQVQASNIEETPGRGLRAHIDAVGCTAIIGNEAWMAEHGATIGSELIRTLDEWKGQAKSVVLLALSHPGQPTYSVVAAFAIADVIRPEAERVVKTLQKQGISVWMISGDNVLTAKAVARMVGIDEANVIADVLPHEKVSSLVTEALVSTDMPFNRRTKYDGCNRSGRSDRSPSGGVFCAGLTGTPAALSRSRAMGSTTVQ
jgi:Cu+-exporting ATPase